MAEMRRMRPLLGCYVEVGATGRGAAAALAGGFERLEQAHAWWSFHSPDSELTRINGHPGERVPATRATLHLLRLARAVTAASGGAFNCTVGGELVARGILPDHGGPAALPAGTAQDIELGAGWVRLARPVRLTLDGIAKGFAVDLAVAAMRAADVQGGWVNAGGDLRVFGTTALPVTRREEDGTHAPLGLVRDAAVATSRVGFERSADFQGCVVSASGRMPARGLHTVMARSAWRADALTKVAAHHAPAARAEAVRRLGGLLLEPQGGPLGA